MARHLDRCRAICYHEYMTTCGWFLECTNEATTKVFHPIVGDVPTCERCAKIATNAHDPKADVTDIDGRLIVCGGWGVGSHAHNCNADHVMPDVPPNVDPMEYMTFEMESDV